MHSRNSSYFYIHACIHTCTHQGPVFNDIALRLLGHPAAFSAVAVAGHQFVTSNFAQHALAGLGTGLIEVGSFAVCGLFYGVLSALREYVTVISYECVCMTMCCYECICICVVMSVYV